MTFLAPPLPPVKRFRKSIALHPGEIGDPIKPSPLEKRHLIWSVLWSCFISFLFLSPAKALRCSFSALYCENLVLFLKVKPMEYWFPHWECGPRSFPLNASASLPPAICQNHHLGVPTGSSAPDKQSSAMILWLDLWPHVSHVSKKSHWLKFCLAFSYKDGDDDFKVLFISELKAKV